MIDVDAGFATKGKYRASIRLEDGWHEFGGGDVADDIPELGVAGPQEGDLLVLSWGGSRGAAVTAVERLQGRGHRVAHAQLRYLNPFPRNLGEVLRGYRTVMIPELNEGQLAMLVRAQYLVEVASFTRQEGRPFTVAEIEARAMELLA